MKTKVSKGELIVKLETNRDGHRTLFLKALDGFHKEVTRLLEVNLAAVKAGSRQRVYIGEVPPEDHTKDYDTVIGMVKMSTEDTVELDYADFRRYVMDDWDWKQQWVTSNSKYTS